MALLEEEALVDAAAGEAVAELFEPSLAMDDTIWCSASSLGRSLLASQRER